MALRDDSLLTAAVQSGLIESTTLDTLRTRARREQLPLVDLVLAHHHIPTSTLYRAVAQVSRVDFVDRYGYQVHEDWLKKISGSLMRRKLFLPVLKDDVAYLAVSDPQDQVLIDSVFRMIDQTVPVVMVDPVAMGLWLEQVLPPVMLDDKAATAKQEAPDLVALLDDILKEAYLSRASDIHLLVEEAGLRVRLRVDGKLLDIAVSADAETAAGLISRVKVLASLDIAEQRLPQDGSFAYHLAPPIDQGFNLRVATVLTRLGERVTMRLLSQETTTLTLTDLGMSDDNLTRFKQAIESPYGMILLTGPTGSGKSTTLCAALQEIDSAELNVMTVEDPIEYVMADISQIQTGPKVSFAQALRSLLRHDPDVLMVGEIRDHETADVAVKSAMTGHLVFSTLHTNNAVSAVTRLIDIGCESFLIGSTMTAVIAQRLVRRLCVHCRQARVATEEELALLDASETVEVHDAMGCVHCQGTGYSGRLGLFETLWFDERLAKLVAQGAGEDEIEAAAGEQLQFMWEDGCEKVRQGMTTLSEVSNVAIHKTHEMVAAH